MSRASGRPLRRRKPVEATGFDMRYLIAGGSMLALVGVLVDLRAVLPSTQATPVSNVCQEIVQPQSVLSREELAQVLQIPERDHRANVQRVVSDPYCRLSSVEIRAGVASQRDAYPLEFDPQTWFVVLYEGEEYAGYSFVFQR